MRWARHSQHQRLSAGCHRDLDAQTIRNRIASRKEKSMRRAVVLLALLFALSWLQLPSSAQSQTCPCSVWSDTTVPSEIDGLDPAPGEYGFRFQASSNGYINGIRFYKSAANTGVHTGNL